VDDDQLPGRRVLPVTSTPPDRVATRFALLAVGTVTLGVAGLAGFVAYARAGLPAESGSGLYLLAGLAGAAAMFSPCSFGLLVTILARPRTGTGRAAATANRAAGVAVGAALFLAFVAVGIGLLGSAATAGFGFTTTVGRTLRLGVGAALILLGLVQIGRIPMRLEPRGGWRFHTFMESHARSTDPRFASDVPFGFVYLLAGFG
jgi:cytochrome c biogenesis protein CcdA